MLPPGYDVIRPLGRDVWLAVQVDAGDLVVLRRVGDGGEPVLDGEHLVRCREVCHQGGDVVLVVEHCAGGSLRARRGQLSPGQVVTVVAPIAGALALAHAQGVVHGRLTASKVLLTAAGKPVLDGLGRYGGKEPHADVLALAALGQELLHPGARGAVPDALAAAGHGDAGALATALLAACLAEPLDAPAVRQAAPPPRRRWPVALALLLAAVVVLVLVLRHAAAPTASWSSVLQGLDAQRAAAFARGDSALLAAVYSAHSPALVADAGRLSALRDRQESAHGLRHRLASVQVSREAGDQAQLEVVAGLAGYEIRGPKGARRLVPAGAMTAQRVSLVRTPRGWRIAGLAVSG